MLPDVEINVKCKIDEKSYKECVDKINELKALESDIIGNQYLSNLKYISNLGCELVDVGSGFSNLSRKLKNECDHIEEDETAECIPATLKDVCEWWIKTYPNNKHIFKNIPRSVIEECPENTEYQRCCNIADVRGTVAFILKSME